MKSNCIVVLFGVVVSALLGHAGCAQTSDRITFNLSWLPQGSTAGVLVAIDKGYYAQEGLEVVAVRGYGGQRTVNEVDQGLFQFGYGDPISVALNRAAKGKTVMIGAINTRWPGGLCYIADPARPIRGLDDLKDQTLSGGPTSPVHNLVPAWLEMNGLPKTHLRLVRMDPAVINASLLEGKTSLAECWAGANKPVLVWAAQKAGKSINSLWYRDYGLDVYGSGIVTTTTFAAEQPDRVRRFLKATYRGYADMAVHPDDAVAIVLKRFPTLEGDVLGEQIREINELIVDPDTSSHGLGWMARARMEKTLAFVRSAFASVVGVTLDDLYTNTYLE